MKPIPSNVKSFEDVSRALQLFNAHGADLMGLNKTAGRIIVADGTNWQSVAMSGDATITAAGLLTIAAEAVTLAKIQHIATDKLLGRVTAATGDVEEITCTDFAQSLLDDADAATGRTTLGLGTIATQAANNVAITGGAISGTTVGAASASTGAFTTVSATGQITSTLAVGTAPFAITSTTMSTNLNADLLDGSHATAFAAASHTHSEYLNKDGTVALTASWDAGSFEIRAQTFQSDVVTGTAPFTVASTTVVTNLNASLLEGNNAAAFATAAHTHSVYLNKDGTVPLTGDWDAGSFEIRAQTFESDIVTGTAPFVIASTTVSTNLNADLLDGSHATAFAAASHGLHFVSRNSDLAAYDWLIGSFTTDGAAHTLDCSAIVPAGATRIRFKCMIQDDAVDTFIQIRKNGYSNWVTSGMIKTWVINVVCGFEFTVDCDTNRVVEYQTTNTTITGIYLAVLGWWI